MAHHFYGIKNRRNVDIGAILQRNVIFSILRSPQSCQADGVFSIFLAKFGFHIFVFNIGKFSRRVVQKPLEFGICMGSGIFTLYRSPGKIRLLGRAATHLQNLQQRSFVIFMGYTPG